MRPCSMKLLGSSVSPQQAEGPGGRGGPPPRAGKGMAIMVGVPTWVPRFSIASPLPGPRAKGDKPPVKEPRGKAKAHPPEPPQQEHDFLGCMSK